MDDADLNNDKRIDYKEVTLYLLYSFFFRKKLFSMSK